MKSKTNRTGRDTSFKPTPMVLVLLPNGKRKFERAEPTDKR